MQLTIVESRRDVVAAQKSLQQSFERLPHHPVRTVSFKPAARREEVATFGPGRVWGVFHHADDESTPRYWNAFGVLPESPTERLFISVECNVPYRSSSRIASFYARDAASGRILLMHDGGLRGGRPGISRAPFLAWTADDLIPVAGADGPTRRAMVVAVLDHPDTALQIEAFVRRVARFKAEVTGQELPAAVSVPTTPLLASDEYRGRKTGTRASSFDYVTYHGDVVRALMAERKQNTSHGEVVGRTNLIDVAVRMDDKLTEIY